MKNMDLMTLVNTSIESAFNKKTTSDNGGFFHGNKSSADAIELLQSAKAGDFIVRTSSTAPGKLAISFMTATGVQHALVQCENGKFLLADGNNNSYCTPAEFFTYYKESLLNPLTVNKEKPIQAKQKSYNELFEEGKSLYHKRQYSEAKNCFEMALNEIFFFHDVNKCEIWHYKGLAFKAMKQYSDALACFQYALKSQPDHYESFRMQMEIHKSQGNHQAMLDCQADFIYKNPTHTTATCVVKNQYFLTGKKKYQAIIDESIERIFQLQTTTENGGFFHDNLPVSKAVSLLKQMKRRNIFLVSSVSWKLNFIMVVSLNKNGVIETDFLEPTNYGFVQKNITYKTFDDYLVKFKSIQATPVTVNCADDLLSTVTELMSKNQYLEAQTIIDEAIAISEKEPMFWYQKSLVLQQQDKHDDAMSAIKRAVQYYDEALTSENNYDAVPFLYSELEVNAFAAYQLQAELFVRQGNFSAAHDLYNAFLDSHKAKLTHSYDMPIISFEIAKLFVLQRELDRALSMLFSLSAEYVRSGSIMSISIAKGNEKVKEQAFQLKIMIMLYQKKYQDAHDYLQQSERNIKNYNGNNALAIYLDGYVYLLENNDENAQEKLNKQSFDELVVLGKRLLTNKGAFVSDAPDTLNSDQNKLVLYWFLQAVICEARGRTDLAISCYQKMTHDNKLHPLAIIAIENLTSDKVKTLTLSVDKTIPEISYDDLRFENILGQGSFGIVYKGVWKQTPVAIKKLKQDQLSERGLEQFQNEMTIMAKLRHPNIIVMYGAVQHVETMTYCIVMEYMQDGSLYQLLKNKTPLTVTQQKQIAFEMAAGLNYLHSNDILHRDFKSLNILVKKTGEDYSAKLTDFGLAKIKKEEDSNTATSHVIGTEQWTAPEVLDGQKPTKASDVYSYGVVLWEIVSQKLPLENVPRTAVAKELATREQHEVIPENCPAGIAILLGKCWDKRAEKRITTSDILVELSTEHDNNNQKPEAAQPQQSNQVLSTGYAPPANIKSFGF